MVDRTRCDTNRLHLVPSLVHEEQTQLGRRRQGTKFRRHTFDTMAFGVQRSRGLESAWHESFHSIRRTGAPSRELSELRSVRFWCSPESNAPTGRSSKDLDEDRFWED